MISHKHSYIEQFNFRKDWLLTIICIIIMFVGLPVIWIKRFVSKKMVKNIPRSNIIPMSLENNFNQIFGTKSSHSTSKMIVIQPIQTIGETMPALKFSYNTTKHNKNLISLTGIFILFALIFSFFSLVIASRFGWISIHNLGIYMYFCLCFVPIVLPTIYFTRKPQHLIVVLKDFDVI